ncbi:RES family NAD+ phosphorylase [Rufibacter latericius]|uniref:RES domain-containing protein n=1 Tax=Rufibacter latericius TaxID=2487040 RepID=A0A3M9MER0_9BACT|nr:RES family NAD+ phosphorylase [Rufibacter latericius]RNI24062.1 RES domain-containing protein [Rufibacter latericius]
MVVYRLAKRQYVRDLSGTGGLYGSGRWHEKGTRILYTAGSFSLAKLEVLANTKILPKNYSLLVLEIPEDIARKELSAADLPANWNSFPHPKELAAFTEEWVKENKYLVMRVPSVHSPFEFNYLINPLHPEAGRLRILEDHPHEFDARLK